METTTPQAPAAPEKKSLFDTIVISTPVLLTVIATFILGRSSSEMTQAQYHRSLAGQNQSKSGDQWALFQAKRIRGNIYEVTADLLAAQKADLFTADTLVDTSEGIIREIQLTAKELKPASKASAQLDELDKKAAAALKQIKATLDPPKDGTTGSKGTTLKAQTVRAALDALRVYPENKQDKSAADPGIDADQLQKLNEVLDDIRKFKPDKQIAPKTLKIDEATLDKAMEKATANAAEVAARGKAIDRVLEEFDALVESQTTIAREFQRTVGGYLSAAVKEKTIDADEVLKLERRLERMRGLSAKLQGDYKAARHHFTAHRYEDDARSNQEAAYLYDVYVLQSSARSDKHLQRSFGFLIAMLVAQVGVTIASLALMLRFRLPVWAVAALAGIIAIAFGVCVFLEMAPLI